MVVAVHIPAAEAAVEHSPVEVVVLLVAVDSTGLAAGRNLEQEAVGTPLAVDILVVGRSLWS